MDQVNQPSAFRQFDHGALPARTPQEESRDLFVKSLKFHIATKIAPGVKLAYDSRVLPAYRKKTGQDPENYHKIRQLMAEDPYFQLWSAAQRASQELQWRSAQVPLERQFESLSLKDGESKETLGSLRLNPDLEIPSYAAAVDVHCMPGGYFYEGQEGDYSTGALYDRGVWIYTMGILGPLNDGMGQAAVSFIKKNFPDLRPKRILDMGCTVGHSTLPHCDAFPDAEIHAIDLSAPALRYAHLRAESLGKKVHFSQQNAEKTDFPDGHFDLIISHILIHETSNKAVRNIMKECYRLLAPGGVVIHMETPPYRMMSDFEAFTLDWETLNNNEPYWGGSHHIDIPKVSEDAGFSRDSVFERVEAAEFAGEERIAAKDFHAGDFGGGGAWFFWGAQKKGDE